MKKFVASVIAGLVATVLGGVILHYVTQLLGTPSASRPEGFQGMTRFATQAEAERVCGKDFWVVPPNGPFYCDRNSN